MLLKQNYIPENLHSSKKIESLDLPYLNFIEKNGRISIKEWFEDIEMIGEGSIENLLFFDTETSHMNGYACSFGFILTDIYGNIIEKEYIEINPGIKMDPEAVAVHGITDEMVSGSQRFVDIRERIEDLVNKSDILIAFNSIYDIGVLIREYQRLGVIIPDKMLYHMDIMPMLALVVQTYDKNGKKKRNPKLSEAAQILGVKTEENALHNALYDTEIMKEVFFKAKNYEG